MPHWDEMQAKAKGLIEEGLKLLKSGAHDAEFLAGTTASAARLHVIVKRNQIEKYKALHKLGDLVYSAASQRAAALNIELSDQMKKLIKQVKELDKAAADAESALSKFSVVKKSGEKEKGKKQTKRR